MKLISIESEKKILYVLLQTFCNPVILPIICVSNLIFLINFIWIITKISNYFKSRICKLKYEIWEKIQLTERSITENLIGYWFITCFFTIYMDVTSSSIYAVLQDGSQKVKRKKFVDYEVNSCSTRPSGRTVWTLPWRDWRGRNPTADGKKV